MVKLTVNVQDYLCEFYIYFALDYGQDESFELVLPILKQLFAKSWPWWTFGMGSGSSGYMRSLQWQISWKFIAKCFKHLLIVFKQSNFSVVYFAVSHPFLEDSVNSHELSVEWGLNAVCYGSMC